MVGLLVCEQCFQKWWKARRHGHKAGGPDRSSEAAEPRSKPKSSVGSSSMLDDAEHELDLLVRNQLLLGIYEKFALEAFHAENIRFLEECARLTDLGSMEQPTPEQLEEIVRLADDIYKMYILPGALMEVNVPARRRESVERALEDLKAVLNRADPAAAGGQVEMKEYAAKAAVRPEQAAKQLEALMQAYGQAYFDIRILLARDSWPRFRLSRYFPQYKRATTEERQTSIAIQAVTQGGRREGKHTSDDGPASPAADDTSPRTKRASESGGGDGVRISKRGSESNHSSRNASSNGP